MKKQITLLKGFIRSLLKNKFKLFLLPVAALLAGGLQAQPTIVVPTITTPGTSTFTLPAGVQSVTVECWGGGGAGGSAIGHSGGTTLNYQARAAGGAGGSYSKVTFTPPITETIYNYTVGAGGAGDLTGAFTHDQVLTTQNGGTSTFGISSTVLVSAQGGPGGGNAINTAGTASANATTKGIAFTSNNIGDIGFVFYGGNGSNLGAGGGNSGYGGGSAGATGNGGNATVTAAGAAGTGGGAQGGVGNTGGSAGTAGGAPGAGGGAAHARDRILLKQGGAGGNGKMIITYTLIPVGSTVAITAPANKTVVAIDGSIQISATIGIASGRTFSSIEFKDGASTIPGTITNVGDVYSITYANVPAGKRTITAILTDNVEPKTSANLIIYGGPVATVGNKYAQSAITWSAGPWYDDPTDGQVVTAPAAGDNVFTQGNAVNISDDATCDNLTFTNVLGQIAIAADKTLTVRGQVDCATTASLDAFSTSNATSTLKLTGATLASPYLLVTNNAIAGIRPHNLVIDPADLSNTYLFGNGTNDYTHGSATFEVKAGTLLTLKNNMIMGTGVNNHTIVGAGAVVTIDQRFGGEANLVGRTTKATINGTVIPKGNFCVKELVLGATGYMKTERALTTEPLVKTFDAWWGQGSSNITLVASFPTPTTLTFDANSTVEFSRLGDQNVNGVVPANGTAPVAEFPIPYSNLKLSGSGTKTVQTNLTVSKSLDVASGVTMVIPAGKVLVNMGTITGTLPASLGAIVNVAVNDDAKGTVTATISATNEVTLVATAKSGNQFVNWTEVPTGEISSTATLPAFIPTDGSIRTLVANFSISTGLSTTKANAFVTVVGKSLLLNAEINAVEVFNAQGKLIHKENKMTCVNVNNNGIYIVKLLTPQGVSIQKVIVK